LPSDATLPHPGPETPRRIAARTFFERFPGSDVLLFVQQFGFGVRVKTVSKKSKGRSGVSGLCVFRVRLTVMKTPHFDPERVCKMDCHPERSEGSTLSQTQARLHKNLNRCSSSFDRIGFKPARRPATLPPGQR
jgi:hypothetical protein